MDIKTKYNIGDRVYYIFNNTISVGIIKSIDMNVRIFNSDDGENINLRMIQYLINNNHVSEEFVYTKQDLLEYVNSLV
jgi:hypothetical protein